MVWGFEQELNMVDLTSRMAPYFDSHLILPLLDSLRESGLQDAKTVTKEKIAILGKTNMVDVMCDEYERPECDAEVKAAFKAEKATIEKRNCLLYTSPSPRD